MNRAVGPADPARLPPARVYSPGELSRGPEKQVEAQLGAYSITGLELEGVLGLIGEDRGYAKIYGVNRLPRTKGRGVRVEPLRG